MIVARILCYIGSLTVEPFARATLRFFSLIQRDSRIKVGCWTFSGPPIFIAQIQEGLALLEEADPMLLKDLLQREYTCIYAHDLDSLMCMTPWRYMGIPDCYLAWKKEGVVVALVYFYWRITESAKGRWPLTDAKTAEIRSRYYRDRTNYWIKSHGFPRDLMIQFPEE